MKLFGETAFENPAFQTDDIIFARHEITALKKQKYSRRFRDGLEVYDLLKRHNRNSVLMPQRLTLPDDMSAEDDVTRGWHENRG